MSARPFHKDGSLPDAYRADGSETYFVFGSNLAGRHGAGAAHVAAHHFGAESGTAEGLTGWAYAIPTCDADIRPLSLERIATAVERFIADARAHPEDFFFVTRIGCGIAGHRDADIAPLFRDAPNNCSLPDTWAQFL